MFKFNFTFFLLGLSFGIGPCLASCGPLLISYSAGSEKNLKKSILAYLLFSSGRIIVYLIITLLVFMAGRFAISHLIGAASKYVFIAGGIFISVIGLLIIIGKNFDHIICRRLFDLFLKKDNKTVIILGLIIGLLPCAPLVSVVTYIGLVAKNWLEGLFYGFIFGLGTTISPLVILIALGGLISKLFISHKKFYRIFNFVCGLIIIYLGALLIRRGFYA